MSSSKFVCDDLCNLPAEENANPIDIHVGKRIRLLRCEHKLSPDDLAEKMEILPEELLGYECGISIPINLLWKLSKIGKVSVNYFYDEMSEETKKKSHQRILGRIKKEISNATVNLKDNLSGEFVLAINKINDVEDADKYLEMLYFDPETPTKAN